MIIVEKNKLLSKELFDAVPVSIIIIDKKGKILAVNKVYRNITGKRENQMVGKSLFKTSEFRRNPIIKKYLSLLNEGISFRETIEYFSKKQKKLLTFSLSAVPLKIKGEMLGAFSIAQDITGLVDAQKKLDKANSRLEDAVKIFKIDLEKRTEELSRALKSRNEFFADASHELRTPLTIIRGNLDLIYLEHKKNPLLDEIKDHIDNINAEMINISEVLSDITLLSISETSSPNADIKKNVIDLSEMVAQTMKEFSSLAKQKGIELIPKLRPVLVKVDKLKFKKVIYNLISNAVRYIGKGHVIEVSTEANNKCAKLSVKDDGIGIGKDDLPKVFDRFYRAHGTLARKGGGTGLGLAICKYIVKQHGGMISVESEVGHGSTFTVKLPRIKASLLDKTS